MTEAPCLHVAYPQFDVAMCGALGRRLSHHQQLLCVQDIEREAASDCGNLPCNRRRFCSLRNVAIGVADWPQPVRRGGAAGVPGFRAVDRR